MQLDKAAQIFKIPKKWSNFLLQRKNSKTKWNFSEPLFKY